MLIVSDGMLYNTVLSEYYGLSKSVPGPGVPLTADTLNYSADSTVITADATVTP